jgi:glycosidase
MNPWPNHPVVYEVNAWVWLGELSRKHGRAVTFSSVPRDEWDALALRGLDAVWFMGVWERSPAGIAVANRNEGLLAEFRRTLPDFQPEDNVGSPYCVRRYTVDEHLGGRYGLEDARDELARRGLRLLLDFVPNHVAPDHPWVADHPDYFIQGQAGDAQNDPASFLEVEGKVFACGRDPYFPAWPDVLQLNAFDPGLRQAAAGTLLDIARQCDGVRCDMAMLFLNRIFEGTWGGRAGQRPETEYWVDTVSAVKAAHPDFLFMAEAYWDLEWELQQLGFDYCYDKRLYDRLEHGGAQEVRSHLCAEPAYQERLVRFIENHDEPRALAAFSPHKARAAAVAIATIPGAKLYHEGQFDGRKVRLPVFLGRRPDEPADRTVQTFYRTLLEVADAGDLRAGEWRLCGRSGWTDNRSHENLVAWCRHNGPARQLVVVNLSAAAAQGQVQVPWEDLDGGTWGMTDLFTGQRYMRSGNELFTHGLYVDLPPWGFHLLSQWSQMG